MWYAETVYCTLFMYLIVATAQHWKRVLCPIIRKGSWDDEEELKLFHLVEKYGQSWKNIASEIGSRTDIQCRYQYFKSCMSREVAWSPQEDDLLMKKMNGILIHCFVQHPLVLQPLVLR